MVVGIWIIDGHGSVTENMLKKIEENTADHHFYRQIFSCRMIFLEFHQVVLKMTQKNQQVLLLSLQTLTI